MTFHQQGQVKVINDLELQVKNGSLQFTTVSPVKDFERDERMCLTSVHIPSETLKAKVWKEIMAPLLPVPTDCYLYPNDSLHMTIKNIRVINNPPHFTQQDIQKAQKVLSEVVPTHARFAVYFYRLLLFPNNLALVGITDPELDELILDLDRGLTEAGVPDDKVYSNDRYFFSNMTLLRFSQPPTEDFKRKIKEISQNIHFEPYIVDSVTLLTSNAVLKSKTIFGSWKLA